MSSLCFCTGLNRYIYFLSETVWHELQSSSIFLPLTVWLSPCTPGCSADFSQEDRAVVACCLLEWQSIASAPLLMAVQLTDWLTRYLEYHMMCDHLWPHPGRWYVQHKKDMTHEPAPHGLLHANQQALNIGSEQRDLYQSLPTEVYYSKGWDL